MHSHTRTYIHIHTYMRLRSCKQLLGSDFSAVIAATQAIVAAVYHRSHELVRYSAAAAPRSVPLPPCTGRAPAAGRSRSSHAGVCMMRFSRPSRHIIAYLSSMIRLVATAVFFSHFHFPQNGCDAFKLLLLVELLQWHMPTISNFPEPCARRLLPAPCIALRD